MAHNVWENSQLVQIYKAGSPPSFDVVDCINMGRWTPRPPECWPAWGGRGQQVRLGGRRRESAGNGPSILPAAAGAEWPDSYFGDDVSPPRPSRRSPSMGRRAELPRAAWWSFQWTWRFPGLEWRADHFQMRKWPLAN